MRVVLRSLAILVVVLTLVPATQGGPAAAQSPVVNTGDELVIISNTGRLEARDPYVPTGFERVTWTSPETGFTDVATGDFNGDGSDEVIGLRGNVAQVYDPVPLPGEVNTTHSFTATAGQIWLRVVTGNFDSDGADEVVLVETQSVANGPIRMVAYDFTATGWNRIYSEVQGAAYQGLATGDVMGNGKDQVVGVRTRGSSHEMLIFDPANNWRLIHFGTGYGFPWAALAVGNVKDDSANKDEIVTSRSGTGGSQPSFYVFRWLAGSTGLEAVESRLFNPQFQRIALGDVNASGDKETYLLRNNQASFQAALASVLFGNDPAIDFDLFPGDRRWNGIQTGDVDADSKDEVIIMAPTEYRIFTEPNVSTTSVPETGFFFNNGNFAVGDLDGPGVPSGPTLLVTPLTVPLTLLVNQNASRQITITNTSAGTGTLNWTATVVEGAAWLSMSATSGTTPSTPQLLINTGGIAPASYVGRVRIDAPGANGTPQTITVNLTVTAPQFAVQPNQVSWLYTPPVNPGVRTVSVSGQNVAWHAGVVPTSVAAQIEQAVMAGQPVKLQEGQLVIGDGHNAEAVPIVDWIDLNPVSGVATPGGILVDMTLVLDRVPYGFRSAAVVFVADTVASPPALVVRTGVLRTQPGAADITYLPLIEQRR